MNEYEALKLREVEYLEKIATALEGINQSLDSISSSCIDMTAENPLHECISKTRAGSALCVTGSITTSDY